MDSACPAIDFKQAQTNTGALQGLLHLLLTCGLVPWMFAASTSVLLAMLLLVAAWLCYCRALLLSGTAVKSPSYERYV
jgi:hypothetical protein